MMNTMKMTAAALAALLVLWSGAAVADEKHHKEVDEEELGIRKESVFEEGEVEPEHGEYSHSEPGKSQKLGRAFENSPPLIPHDLTGMLPIAETNNSCLNCHMPAGAVSIGATPMPKSHFFDIETGKDLGDKLDGKRYFCMECHVPQVDIPEAIKNEFKGEFRTKKSRTRSDLIDKLNEGVKAE
ncbi:MAG: nitrate reductase cytochrome c-type subunit [Nitrospirota bacterium]|nr:nitrate reductase cytochrome c-type subunit [Nitrospirota bacterium]